MNGQAGTTLKGRLDPRRTPGALGWLGVVALVGATTFAAYARYREWNFDDAYIVFRIASNLASGQGWAFNPGEIHNPTTSVVQPLLLAGAGRLVDVVTAAHLLGAAWIFGMGLVGFALFSARFGAEFGVLAGVTFVWALVWTQSWGLETHLFVLLLFAFSLAEQRRWNSWPLLALAVLVRPDALALVGIKWLWEWWSTRSLSLAGVAWLVALYLPWAVFSWLHFGSILPDTLDSKVWQGESGMWGGRVIYVVDMWRHMWFEDPYPFPVYIFAIFGWACAAHDRSPLVWVFAFVVLQQVAYCILDVPGYHWYFAAFDVAAVAGVLYLGGRILARLGALADSPRLRITRLAVLLAVAAAVVVTAVAGVRHPKRNLRDVAYRELATLVNSLKAPPGALAVTETGTVGYLVDRPIVDIIGLTSANPPYVSPDTLDGFFAEPPMLVVLHEPPLAFERSLFADPRFARHYEPASDLRRRSFHLTIFRHRIRNTGAE